MAVPRHVAIIMDGNGRWAKKRALPREAGHTMGAKNVEKIAEAADNLGIEPFPRRTGKDPKKK